MLRFAALVWAFALAAAGSDVTGTWDLKIDVPGHNPKSQLSFVMEQDKLTGKVITQGFSIALRNLRQEGNRLRFDLPVQANVYSLEFEVAGDTMTGTFTAAPGMTAKAVATRTSMTAADAPPVPAIPQPKPALEPTSDQWREDVQFLAKELPRLHKNAFHMLRQAEFERRVNELVEAIPRMQGFEIRAAIARLVAAVADGHTHAGLKSDWNFDLQFRPFPEGLFVTGGAKEYEAAVGARVVSIDGMPASEIGKRLAGYVPMENEFAAQDYAGFVGNGAAMKAAGVIRSMEGAEFLLEKGGRSFAMTVKTRLAKNQRPGWVKDTREQPLYLQRAGTAYWWKYLAEAKTLYIQYNSCREMEDLPFQKFTDQIVEQVNHEAPEKIVIDLRLNGGGNSEVSNPLLRAMQTNKALRPRGGVHVLVSAHTFSSGLLVAVRLADRLRAMVVGEPPGEALDNYGEMRSFRLPNSGIMVTYSTKHFVLGSGGPALMPDLPVILRAPDYFAGRDPVMEAVLKLPDSAETNYRGVLARNKDNLHALRALAEIYQEQGRERETEKLLRTSQGELAAFYLKAKKYPQARAAAMKALRADPNSKRAMDELGDAYMGEHKYAQAAEMFEKLYRLEPDNPDPLEKAADAYIRNGKPDQAITEYQEEIAKAKQSEMTLNLRLLLSEAYRRKGDAADAVRTFVEDCGLIAGYFKTDGSLPPAALNPLREFFESKLKAEPDDGVLMHNLAFVLAKGGTDSERALKLAREARQKLPDVREVGETLAWLERK